MPFLKKQFRRSTDFCGRPVIAREVSGFEIRELAFCQHQVLPEHSHPFAFMSLLVKGAGVERWDHGTSRLRPGTALFQPAGDLHADCFRSDALLIALKVRPGALRQLAESGFSVERRREIRNTRVAYLGSRLAAGLTDRDPATELSLEGLALELLAELLHQRARQERRLVPIERALGLIRDRFMEPIRLAVVSAEVGLPPVRLAQEFRRQHGMTVGGYIRKLRIEYACTKLSASVVSVSELAHELGFADHSHFSHAFKQYTGLSPRQFRAASRS
jgi:AraC family transcriptional regulator